MSGTKTNLDYGKCCAYIDAIQAGIEEIRGQTQVWQTAFQEAQDKSTHQKWMSETLEIGSNAITQCLDTTAMLEDLKLALRKFEEDLTNFAEEALGVDC